MSQCAEGGPRGEGTLEASKLKGGGFIAECKNREVLLRIHGQSAFLYFFAGLHVQYYSTRTHGVVCAVEIDFLFGERVPFFTLYLTNQPIASTIPCRFDKQCGEISIFQPFQIGISIATTSSIERFLPVECFKRRQNAFFLASICFFLCEAVSCLSVC